MNKEEIREELEELCELMESSLSYFEVKSYRYTYNTLMEVIERCNKLSTELLEIV